MGKNMHLRQFHYFTPSGVVYDYFQLRKVRPFSGTFLHLSNLHFGTSGRIADSFLIPYLPELYIQFYWRI